MVEEGVDAVVLSIGADLPYFTGYEAMDSERPTVLIVSTTGIPVLVIPLLEAPRVESSNVELASWHETRGSDGSRRSCPGWCQACRHWGPDPFLDAPGDPGGAPGCDLVPVPRSSPRLSGFARIPDEVEMLRSAASAVDRALKRIPAEVRFFRSN